jgi:fumarate reductase iron-sulfur subunit
MAGANDNVTVRVRRYSPAAGFSWSTYTIPYEQRMSVLTALRWIYENLDPTLTIRQEQCGRGLCTVCNVKLGGRTQKACTVPVNPGDELVVEPHNPRKVLRDMVCANE